MCAKREPHESAVPLPEDRSRRWHGSHQRLGPLVPTDSWRRGVSRGKVAQSPRARPATRTTRKCTGTGGHPRTGRAACAVPGRALLCPGIGSSVDKCSQLLRLDSVGGISTERSFSFGPFISPFSMSPKCIPIPQFPNLSV